MRTLFLFVSFVVMPLSFAAAQEVSRQAVGPDQNTEVMEKPDKLAQFPGGLDAYVTFLGSNLQYPEKARRAGVEGRVVLQFVVDKAGNIRNIKVLKSLSPECDKEAIRMVKAMPRWFPAEHEGRKVNCLYTCPINFKL